MFHKKKSIKVNFSRIIFVSLANKIQIPTAMLALLLVK